MKNLIFKIFKVILYFLLVVFALASILPYFLPVNNYETDVNNPPFTNSKFIKIENKNWHYRIFENKDSLAGTLVFIHGFSGSTFSWRKQEMLMDLGYRIISVDLPAFGYSEKNKNAFNHSPRANAENIWKLLNKIGISEHVSIFGHSMGASVAWEMLGTNPEKCINLFLVDGTVNLNEKPKQGLKITLAKLILRYPPILRWSNVLGKAYFFRPEKFEKLLTSAYSVKSDSESAEGYLKPFMLKNSASAVLEFFIHNYPYKSFNPEIIKCPVHLIWGMKDQWIPIAVAEKFIKQYPKAELHTLKDAGHCPMETHSDEFNMLVKKLIDK